MPKDYHSWKKQIEDELAEIEFAIEMRDDPLLKL